MILFLVLIHTLVSVKCELENGQIACNKSSGRIVCSGHGNCSDNYTCLCISHYYGDMCEDTECFGIISNETNVCNGHGKCIGYGDCVCVEDYEGENCEILRDEKKNKDIDLSVGELIAIVVGSVSILPIICAPMFLVCVVIFCCVFCCCILMCCGIVCIMANKTLASDREGETKPLVQPEPDYIDPGRKPEPPARRSHTNPNIEIVDNLENDKADELNKALTIMMENGEGLGCGLANNLRNHLHQRITDSDDSGDTEGSEEEDEVEN